MSRTLRAVMNESDANKMPSAMQLLGMGEAMNLVPRTFRGTVTSDVLTLPQTARCAVLLKAYAVAGTVKGEFTPLKQGATVATTQAAPNNVGNVVFLTADAVTEAEVVYLAFEGTVFSDLCAVASHTATLLQGRRAAVLLAATALAGTSPGGKTVVARGTAAPTAGNVALQDAPTSVKFNSTDAITSATITYVAQPVANAVGTKLEATQDNL